MKIMNNFRIIKPLIEFNTNLCDFIQKKKELKKKKEWSLKLSAHIKIICKTMKSAILNRQIKSKKLKVYRLKKLE